MFRNIFGNLTDVVKNLLILNVLFFLGSILLDSQNLLSRNELATYYPASHLFKPYQIITHFFMHADFRHILFNMLGLVFMGPMLERHWGKKRFVIFYFVTAIGAWLLHAFVQGIEVYNITGEFFPPFSDEIWHIYNSPIVGASGAIYGLLMAFGMLFPNTEFMLIFPPIPIKAKWMAIGLGAFAVYQGYQNSPGDSIAHFAHLGGMLFAFIMIKIWQKDRSNFY